MSLNKELKCIKKIVQSLLEIDRKARSSDSYLYLRVIQVIADEKGIYLENVSVPYFLENMREMGFPAFETVRRTRQKLQAENPELSANGFTAEKRAENETVYNAFAKEGA